MSKATWVKIAQVCVTAIPPVVVFAFKCPVLFHDTAKALSAGGVLLSIILMMIFKDATKRAFATPSAFKTCVVVFAISLVAVTIGEQMLIISATALVSGACGIPLGIWYNNLTRPATTDDVVVALQDLTKEKNENEESSETD